MTTWTDDELNKVGTAEELQLTSRRRDGSLRRKVIIWVVRVGDDLYIRCVNGREGAWFRGVQMRFEGRIWAGGVEKDVEYVAPMVTPEVRAATLKLVPRTKGTITKEI
jgi:hypothetical protein